MSNEFYPDWPHGFLYGSDASKARLICRDADGTYPLIFLITQSCERGEYPVRADTNGRSASGVHIINAPAPKRKFAGWINMYYRENASVLHETKELADRHSRDNRIACVRVEFEEGDGL